MSSEVIPESHSTPTSSLSDDKAPNDLAVAEIAAVGNTDTNELAVSYLNPNELLPYKNNARTHSPKQIKKISRSIKNFGFINPILVNGNGEIVAGHGRLLAALQLGLSKVPVVKVEYLTDTELRAYRLADNKLAEDAGWDVELVKIEIKDLMDLDFDVDLTGFSTPEIDVLLHAEGGIPEVPVPEMPAPAATVTQLGDVWQLKNHRVICGDSRDPKVLELLMQGELARTAITDPPFNVSVPGHVSGLGKHQHANFQMASGEMTPEQFIAFLTESIGAMANACMDGALLYLFMDWRHLPELQNACVQLHLTPINLCVWIKRNGGMGALYRSQHELVYVVKKGKTPHLNNVELGKHGRYRTNVWHCAGMNSFGSARDELLAMHPTVKPVQLIADAILDASHPGDIVLDSFLGSGTAILAAESCHRRCFGIEIEPGYVDVALQRWMTLTGQQPVHAETGLTFAELRQQRLTATKSI